MELTQTAQYFFTNECGSGANYWLTELAYILVIVQPLMFHTVSYLRARDQEALIVSKVSISMFAVWMFFSILGRVLYNPVVDSFVCTGMQRSLRWSYLYGDEICTLRDSPTSHLYWQWTSANMKDFNANYLCYLIIWFIPPLFVRKERMSILTTMTSYLIGLALTLRYGKMEEHAATWCYVSSPVIAFYFVANFINYNMKMKMKEK